MSPPVRPPPRGTPRAAAAPEHPGPSTEPRPSLASSLGYAARERAWWLLRGAARALRPVVSRSTFERLFGVGRVGYLLNLNAPATFTEKLLWLKRHYRHPLMPSLADKLAVRDYVRSRAPELLLPQVYTVSDDADGFDFDALPDRAVIKPTHTSGRVAFWGPGADREDLRARMRSWLASRQESHLYEWFYAAVAARVFAEQDLSDPDGVPPHDYKVFVVNGRARLIQVFMGRGRRLRRVTFDPDWRIVAAWRSERPGGRPDVVPTAEAPPRPERLADLLAAAERLAAPFPFARVDLYVVEDQLYFGEITFMPSGGYVAFEPRTFDRELGSWLTLPPVEPAERA